MIGKKESGEMYSPNESGEYTLRGDAPNFTVQGLQNALNETESTVTGTTVHHRRIYHSTGRDNGGQAGKAADHQHIHGMEVWCGTP